MGPAYAGTTLEFGPVIASQRVARMHPMTGSAKQSIAVGEVPVSSHVDDKVLTHLGVG
jgi:hypothetical protein